MCGATPITVVALSGDVQTPVCVLIPIGTLRVIVGPASMGPGFVHHGRRIGGLDGLRRTSR